MNVAIRLLLGFALLAVTFPLLSSHRVWAADDPAGDLPAVALGDDVLALSRVDLDGIDVAGLLRSASENLNTREVMFQPYFKTLDIASGMLRAAGVQRLVKVEMQSNEMVRFFLIQMKSAATDSGEIESAIKKAMAAILPPEASESMRLTKVGNWFVLAPAGLKADAQSAIGDHGVKLLAAWKALGKRPGVAFVPTKRMLDEINAGFGAAQASMPPDFAKSGKLAMQLEWAALAAKLDDKPALKLIAALPDDSKASEFVTAYLASMKILQKMMPPDSEEMGNRSLFSYLIPTLVKLQPTAADSRVMATADSAVSIALLDSFFVMPNRLMLNVGLEPGHERLAAMNDWVQAYRLAKKKWPRKLADLQPLMGETPKEQQEMMKRLQTNPTTKESPSIAYSPPAAGAPPAADDDSAPTLLTEMKGGKPDPDGWKFDTRGTMTRIKKISAAE